jgi:hypothetical protein
MSISRQINTYLKTCLAGVRKLGKPSAALLAVAASKANAAQQRRLVVAGMQRHPFIVGQSGTVSIQHLISPCTRDELHASLCAIDGVASDAITLGATRFHIFNTTSQNGVTMHMYFFFIRDDQAKDFTNRCIKSFKAQ